jgi:hypothetical protein
MQAHQPQVQVGQYPLSQVIEQQMWKSDSLAQVANVCFPVTALDTLPPNHKPSLSVIRVDLNPTSKDTYTVGGQKALSKHVLLKMANAGGLHIRTRKVSPRADLDNIEWEAIAMGRLPDGTPIYVKCSKSWSWVKCQEQMSGNQAKEYRKFADEQTETKAILRCVRAGMNLKTSYTADELQKPFLIARAVFSPDMSDPEIKRMVTQQQLASQNAIYGAADDAFDTAQPALPEPTILPDDEEEEEAVQDAAFEPTPESAPEPTAVLSSSDDNYDPFAPAQQAEEAAIDAKLRAIAAPSSQGGIGATLGRVLARHNVTTLIGASFDMKLAILEDAKAVQSGALQL